MVHEYRDMYALCTHARFHARVCVCVVEGGGARVRNTESENARDGSARRKSPPSQKPETLNPKL